MIQPSPGVDLGIVSQLAETAVSSGSSNHYFAYFQVTKERAEYRQGHLSEAAMWLRQAIDNQSCPEASRYLEAYVVLAMANYRLNQTGEARSALAKGIEIEQGLPRNTDDLGPYWMDWIIGHVLLKEAKALIDVQPAAVGEPAIPKQP